MGEGLPANAPVQVVREDPENPSQLYSGTRNGLFASFDAGGHRVKIGDLPAVEVGDLKIQERTADLVIATHGLSLYVLDDTRPLRELTPETAAQPAHLFSVRPVEGAYRRPGFDDWNGVGIYHGANAAEGAVFTVWVEEFTGDEIKLKVTNAAGQTGSLTAVNTAFSRSRFSSLTNAYVLPPWGVYAGLIYEGNAIRFAQSALVPVLLPDERLKPNTRIDVSPLIGATFDAPRFQGFAVFSYTFGAGGKSEGPEAPAFTRNR